MAEIKFDKNFEDNRELPINIGRMVIGKHIMRLMFCPDGKIRASISESAIQDGSVILTPKIEDGILFGLQV